MDIGHERIVIHANGIRENHGIACFHRVNLLSFGLSYT
jgi:hypothetical protein